MTMRNPPRYLFRSHSPGSDGYNNNLEFHSMALANGVEEFQSLDDMPKATARAMIQDHLLWQSNRNRTDDILISFTPSLVFALQHCRRKIEICSQTQPKNCIVTVVDTSLYPRGTFIWTPDLLSKYQLDHRTHKNLQQSYHTAEFVVQYRLVTLREGEALSVSFLELINDGKIYKLLPMLQYPEYSRALQKALWRFRDDNYQNACAVIKADIDMACDLARCFGDKWFLPLTVWALALRSRPHDDEIIHSDFLDGFHGTADEPYTVDETDASSPFPVEVMEYMKIMRIVESAQRSALPRPQGGIEEEVHGADTDAEELDDVRLELSSLRLSE